MADGGELAADIMRSHACLYPDQARRYVYKPSHNPIARNPLAQHNLSSCIKPDQVQRILAGIDTNGGYCGVGLAGHGAVLLL
jgi:hypothetical protein